MVTVLAHKTQSSQCDKGGELLVLNVSETQNERDGLDKPPNEINQITNPTYVTLMIPQTM